MALTPVDLLAAIIPTLGTAHLGGLDRLTIDARGTRGGLTSRGHTSLLTQGSDYLGPGAVVAPLGKVFIHRTLRQQVVRQHIPLVATAVQIEQGIEDFPHVYLPRTSSAWARLGGWDQWCHNGPLRVCQIRRVSLSGMMLLKHNCALLS